MTSYSEIIATLNNVLNSLEDTMAATQRAKTCAESAEGALCRIAQGSTNALLLSASGQNRKLAELLGEAEKIISMEYQTVAGYLARFKGTGA